MYGTRFRRRGVLRPESTPGVRSRRRLLMRPAAYAILAAAVCVAAATLPSSGKNDQARAAVAPVGNGFTVTPADLAFILKQIKIAERHSRAFEGIPDAGTPLNPDPVGDPEYCQSMVGPGKDQIPDRLTSYGLRTVDGSCNNLFAGRDKFAASDQPFPRLTTPLFSAAQGSPTDFFGPGSGTIPSSSYAQKKGFVFDDEPRVISNLIVDQTSTNPAAIAAAELPGSHAEQPWRASVHHGSRAGAPAGRGRARRLRAVAPHALHPERDDRRRPLAAVQLAVHVLRPVLRSRRRPDRQERRHGVRAAARRRSADHARPRRQAQHGRRGSPGPAVHGADAGPEPARP